MFVLEDDKAIRREVKTGISSDSDQQILDGLEPGETVITGPYRTLRNLTDGDPVEIKQDSGEEDGVEVTISTN